MMNLRIKTFLILMVLLIFTSILLSGCSLLRGIIPSLPNKGTGASWTVMVYMGADNDLEEYAWDSLDEMESVGSTDKVNIVVQFDPYETCIGTYRYYVTGAEKNRYPPYYPADIVEPLAEQDMANPDVLSNFVNWATEKYPAEHYLLILQSHGKGWMGIIDDLTTSPGNHTIMTIHGLATGLSNIEEHIDILGFDSCKMQMLEVAYEISMINPPDYIVGSEESNDQDKLSIFGTSFWPYDEILSCLTNNPKKKEMKLCKSIVDNYVTLCIYVRELSVLHNLEIINQAKSVIDNFANSLIHSIYQKNISLGRISTQSYHGKEYKDLYDFARRVEKNVPDCKTQAKSVMDFINNVVYYDKHREALIVFDLNNSYGISIYLPDSPQEYNSYYDSSLLFADDTKWDVFLKTVCERLPMPTLYDPVTSVPSGTSYTVSWPASSGAISYTLQESTSSKFDEVQTYYLADTSKNFTHNVSSNTAYYYRVAALNDDTNQASCWSNIVDIDVTVLKAYEYEIQWSNAESNGWSNPLGMEEELITSAAYDYDSPIYLKNWGKRHVGIDVHAQLDSNVFSIADGTIVKITRDYSSNKNNSVIIIKHVNSDHEPFFTIYGHVLAKGELDVNEKVKAGENIGTIKKAGSPIHLHFGINLSSDINDFIDSNLQLGWGRVPVDVNPADYGWVNPIDYLNTHQTEAVVSNLVAISWTDHIPSNSQNIEYLINVFWDSYPEASGYKVYRSVNGVVEAEPVYSGPGELIYDKDIVQWHDTDIVVGNTYSYYVTAYGDGWETSPSQKSGSIDAFLPPIYLVSPSNGDTINNPTPVFKWSPVGPNPEGCKNFGTTVLCVIDLTSDKELVWQIVFDDMTTFSVHYNQDGQASLLIPGHSYGWEVTSYGYAENMEDAISQSEYWEFTYIKPIIGDIVVPQDYATIQEAINAANPGDTIIVSDGTYTENVDVNKDHITIKSENGADSTIVQAANSNDHVFEVTAGKTDAEGNYPYTNYVNISGFTIMGTGEFPNINGIYLYYADYCSITNNILSDNGAGVFLVLSSNNKIKNNNALYNDTGIRLYGGCDNNTLEGNKLSNNRWGLNIDSAGISADNNKVIGNDILNNENGILLNGSWCGSYCNEITKNNVSNNSGYSIGFIGSLKDNYIYLNNFITNGTNVYFYKNSSLVNVW